MNKIQLFIVLLIVHSIFFLSCNTREVFLSEDIINTIKSEDIVLPSSEKKDVQLVQNDKLFKVINVLEYDYTSEGVFYCFLKSEIKEKQVLVVVDKNTDYIGWTPFYQETSHFFVEDLVSIVILPFEYPLRDVHILVNDYKKQKIFREVNEFRGTYFKYCIPSFGKSDNGNDYFIFWEQAHFPVSKMRYRRNTGFVGFSSNYDNNQWVELNEKKGQGKTIISYDEQVYTLLATQKSNDYIIGIVRNKEISSDWNDLFILIERNNKREMLPLKDFFFYTEEFVSIKEADPRDYRATFIVETSEFKYDFYFDPEALTSDVVFRPSSFTVRYVK